MAKTYRISEETEKIKIDTKDKKILALLAEDGRMPASEIARQARLSRDSVLYRIARLQEKNIILSFIPIIDLKRFGYFTYHVFFLLSEKSTQKQTEFISFLMQHQNTKSLMSYTDTWDAEWTFVAKDLKDFDKILSNVMTNFPNVVLEKEKLAVIRGYSSEHLPNFYYGAAGLKHTTDWKLKPEYEIKIDKTDLALLKLLSQNARQSTYELGEKLKLSADTVSYRIKKLVSSNIIRKFTVILNLSKLGLSWYAYAINFEKFDNKDEAKFKRFAIEHPYVIRAVKTFGPWDAMLYVVSDSMQNYHKTVKEIKTTFSDIIYNYQTWLAHEELHFTALPEIILKI